MKSFRIHLLISFVLFAISFPISSMVSAGTFTATLGSDGLIALDADFCDEFNCQLGIEYTEIGIPYECVVAKVRGECRLHAQDAFTCPHPGHTRQYVASAVGGRWNSYNICAYWGGAF